jgi:hypothetical protein
MFRMPLIPALVLLAFAGHVVLRFASRPADTEIAIAPSIPPEPLELRADRETMIDPLVRDREISFLRKARGSILSGSLLAEETATFEQVTHTEPIPHDATSWRALAQSLRETAAQLEAMAAEHESAAAVPTPPTSAK